MNEVLINDNYWMSHAIELAKRAAALGEVPVGAVIVKDNNMVSEAWNQPISGHDATAHAEVRAIRLAGEKLQNYRIPNTTLYITIEPCAMCLGAIVHARITRVVFGAPEPKAGMLFSNRALVDSGCFNHDFSWQGGVLADACSSVMSDFFKQRRAEKKKEKEKQRQQVPNSD